MTEIDKFLQKYLKSTGRRRTLKELVKSIERRKQNDHTTNISDREPVTLSFMIQKPPERKKANNNHA